MFASFIVLSFSPHAWKYQAIITAVHMYRMCYCLSGSRQATRDETRVIMLSDIDYTTLGTKLDSKWTTLY